MDSFPFETNQNSFSKKKWKSHTQAHKKGKEREREEEVFIGILTCSEEKQISKLSQRDGGNDTCVGAESPQRTGSVVFVVSLGLVPHTR